MAILSRLITPEQFGIFGMVMAFTAFANIMVDIGVSTATIQSDTITHQQASNLFWLNTMVGIALTLCGILAAHPIAHFYNTRVVIGPTIALSTNLGVSCLAVQHRALLKRNLQFGKIALIDTAAAAVSICTGILLAMLGWGHWSLIGQAILFNGTQSLGSVIASGWCPGIPRRRAGTRALIRFGGHLLGMKIGDTLRTNLDNILIGRLHGEASLGQYTRAYQLLTLPLTKGLPMMTTVAVPTLCRIATNTSLYKNTFLNVYKLISVVSIPVSVTAIVFGDFAVLAYLGPRWSSAGRLFQALAPLSLVQAITTSLTWALISQGRSSELLKTSIKNNILAILAIALSAPWGPLAISLVYSITGVFIRAPLWFIAVSRSGPITLSDLAENIAPAIRAGVICVLFAFPLRTYASQSVGPVGCIAISALITAIVVAIELYVSGLAHTLHSIWRNKSYPDHS